MIRTRGNDLVDERLTVTSRDGTQLAVSCTGEGSPIVLVHGMCGQPEDFFFVCPLLAKHHEVWTYARRGRGGSGDADAYALEREVEDVHAVLEATGQPAHLLGHSLGGALALLAAPDADLRSLILYEPALRPDLVDPQAEDEAKEAVARGDFDAAVEAFTRIAGIRPDEIAMIRSVEAVYEGMKASARTSAREGEAMHALDQAVWRDRPVRVPALVLSGAETSVDIYAGEADLGDVLCDGRFVEIDGQAHLATAFATEAFARAVLAFTAEVEGRPA